MKFVFECMRFVVTPMLVGFVNLKLFELNAKRLRYSLQKCKLCMKNAKNIVTRDKLFFVLRSLVRPKKVYWVLVRGLRWVLRKS